MDRKESSLKQDYLSDKMVLSFYSSLCNLTAQTDVAAEIKEVAHDYLLLLRQFFNPRGSEITEKQIKNLQVAIKKLKNNGVFTPYLESYLIDLILQDIRQMGKLLKDALPDNQSQKNLLDQLVNIQKNNSTQTLKSAKPNGKTNGSANGSNGAGTHHNNDNSQINNHISDGINFLNTNDFAMAMATFIKAEALLRPHTAEPQEKLDFVRRLLATATFNYALTFETNRSEELLTPEDKFRMVGLTSNAFYILRSLRTPNEKDNESLCFFATKIGLIYQSLNNNKETLKYLSQALIYAEKSRIPTALKDEILFNLSIIYMNEGKVYQKNGMLPKAINLLKSALHIYLDLKEIKSKKLYDSICLSIGEAYFQQSRLFSKKKEYKKALFSLFEALKLLNDSGLHELIRDLRITIGKTYYTYANEYYTEKEFQLAIDLLLTSISFFSEGHIEKQHKNLSSAYQSLSMCYFESAKQYHLQKEYGIAREHYENAINTFKNAFPDTYATFSFFKNMHRCLSELFEDINDENHHSDYFASKSDNKKNMSFYNNKPSKNLPKLTPINFSFTYDQNHITLKEKDEDALFEAFNDHIIKACKKIKVKEEGEGAEDFFKDAKNHQI